MPRPWDPPLKGDHHPVALGKEVGEVDRLVAPGVEAVEGGLAVAPGAVAVLDAGGDRHAQVATAVPVLVKRSSGSAARLPVAALRCP
jgi:hypothetical protein